MTFAAVVELDENLDWPLSPAEIAEQARLEHEAWGTGPEAEAGLRAALSGLGFNPDDLPVADA